MVGVKKMNKRSRRSRRSKINKKSRKSKKINKRSRRSRRLKGTFRRRRRTQMRGGSEKKTLIDRTKLEGNQQRRRMADDSREMQQQYYQRQQQPRQANQLLMVSDPEVRLQRGRKLFQEMKEPDATGKRALMTSEQALNLPEEQRPDADNLLSIHYPPMREVDPSGEYPRQNYVIDMTKTTWNNLIDISAYIVKNSMMGTTDVNKITINTNEDRRLEKERREKGESLPTRENETPIIEAFQTLARANGGNLKSFISDTGGGAKISGATGFGNAITSSGAGYFNKVGYFMNPIT